MLDQFLFGGIDKKLSCFICRGQKEDSVEKSTFYLIKCKLILGSEIVYKKHNKNKMQYQ